MGSREEEDENFGFMLKVIFLYNARIISIISMVGIYNEGIWRVLKRTLEMEKGEI